MKGRAQIEVDGNLYEITTTKDSVTVTAMEPFEPTDPQKLDNDGFPLPPPPGTGSEEENNTQQGFAPNEKDIKDALANLKTPKFEEEEKSVATLEEQLQEQKKNLTPIEVSNDSTEEDAVAAEEEDAVAAEEEDTVAA